MILTKISGNPAVSVKDDIPNLSDTMTLDIGTKRSDDKDNISDDHLADRHNSMTFDIDTTLSGTQIASFDQRRRPDKIQ